MKTTSTTTTAKVNPFDTDSFRKQVADLQTRSNNAATTTQRMGLGDTSTAPTTNRLTNNAVNNVSTADRQSMSNLNEAIRNNPVFQTNVANNSRDFAEDTRRFNEGLNFKNTADQRANDTDRFRSSTQLEGTKYTADAGVKSTRIGADAQRYGADRQLDGVRLQTDASRYGADRGYQASIYGADRGVDQARIGADAQIRASEIGADASRFNALLGTASNIFNSSGYRPTFNR